MRRLIRGIARRLAAGLAVPGTDRRFRLVVESTSRAPVTAATSASPSASSVPDDAAGPSISHRIVLHHIATLLSRCPALQPFHHPAFDEVESDALAFLTFCNDVVVAFDPEAHEVHLRRHLEALRARTQSPALRSHVAARIAISDLADGVVERATAVAGHPAHADAYEAQERAFDSFYGAEPRLLAVQRARLDYHGDVRGRALRWSFARREAELVGKRILHIAPESEFRSWIVANAARLGVVYETLDGTRGAVDHQADLTALPFDDGAYDILICHRVLEHVMDDAAAMREMFRVLAYDGVLDISVPQSMNRAATKEWLCQDASHHDHVRQYGRDFADKLAAAGFEVSVEADLLLRPLADHLADGTYPMRRYRGRKAPAA